MVFRARSCLIGVSKRRLFRVPSCLRMLFLSFNSVILTRNMAQTSENVAGSWRMPITGPGDRGREFKSRRAIDTARSRFTCEWIGIE
jgi:hypothetical protein